MTRLQIRDFGTSLTFDGSTAYVTRADDPNIRISTSFAVAAWIKPAKQSAASTGEMNIFSKGISSSATYSVSVYLGVSNTLRFSLFDGASNPAAQSNDNNRIGEWQHVACTYDGITMRIYRNGTQVGTTPTAVDVGSQATVMEIGRRAKANDKFFQGKIDGVRLWNTPLNATDIQNIYFTGTDPQPAALKLHWKFDEGSGTTAVDSSSSGLNGTINAATYSSDVVMIPRISS